MTRETLNRLARLGAAARLAELRAEMSSIVRKFPGLTSGTGARRGGVGGRKHAGRKRRKLSAEAREKIAAAQRARWAKVRAAKKAK